MRQLATLLTIITLCSTAIAAQDANRPNTRDGPWFAFGLGAGNVGADCDNCGTGRTNGPSGNLRAGITVTPGVLLGGELTGWRHSSGGVDKTMGFISGVLIWYPSPGDALFFKLGVGAMNYTADDGNDKITASAPSGSLGLGYDIRISGDVSVTPYFNTLSSANATFRLNDSSSGFNSSIKLNLFQVGVGLSWH
jgi:hypothetical protein